jgi:hypothetical protein
MAENGTLADERFPTLLVEEGLWGRNDKLADQES